MLSNTKLQVTTLLLAATLTASFAQMRITLKTTSEAMSQFLDGRQGIVVFGYDDRGDNSGTFFINSSDNSLVIRKICNDIAAAKAIEMAPDGKHIAYATSADVVYVRTLMENSPNSDRRAIASNAMYPHWWIHPTTRDRYIIYAKSDGIYMQKLDASMSADGDATLLFDDERADGGRSMDGRFLAGGGNRVVWELDPVDAVAGADAKTLVYFADNVTGNCYGSMSPSADAATSRNYGCVMHLNGGHTKIVVAKADTDGGFIGDIPLFGQGVIDSFAVVKTIDTPGDDDNLTPFGWKNAKWSTHDDFAVGLALMIDRNNESKYYRNMYLIDITNEKILPVFYSEQNGQDVYDCHLWVESGAAQEVRAVMQATPTRGEAPLTVTFNGSLSGGDGLAYAWRFGDGHNGSGESAEHIYTSAGEYTARLIVASGAGRDTATQLIVIDAAPVEPARITIEPSENARVMHGHSLQFIAHVYDGHDQELFDQEISWSVAGNGLISENGLYRAPANPGCCDTVKAICSGLKALCAITVADDPIKLVSDPGGAAYKPGDALRIRWNADTDFVDNVKIFFSPDNGFAWFRITKKYSIRLEDTAWGDYEWTIDDSVYDHESDSWISVLSDSCLIRVIDYDEKYDPAISEQFSIQPMAASLLGKAGRAKSLTIGLFDRSVNIVYAAEDGGESVFSLFDSQGRRVFHKKKLLKSGENAKIHINCASRGVYFLYYSTPLRKGMHTLVIR